ncbi:MAG: Crp/Fnr family transcriptional regulator [Candidatus Thiodiazotropha taylori]|nr:Crp/Fnr family transcriptional regulator [Candidatus Thiodiazotropha taylori]
MISDTSNITQITQQFQFLQQAERDFQQSFFERASKIDLPADQPICHQGTECTHLALVISGSARVYKLSENGREITLYRIGPGESCILTASCIMNGEPFPAYAVSEEPIEAVLISTADVIRWTDQTPAWRNYLFNLISSRLSEVIGIVEEIAFRRVDRRLAGHLIQLGKQSGARIESTHQMIASDLGTSREVVSRILKDLEQQQMISTARGVINICDEQRLIEKSRENHYERPQAPDP